MATVVGSIWDPAPPPAGPTEAHDRATNRYYLLRRDMDRSLEEHQRFEALVRPLVALDLAAAKSPVDAAVQRCGPLVNRLNQCRIQHLNNPSTPHNAS